jgi:hypothetical protein
MLARWIRPGIWISVACAACALGAWPARERLREAPRPAGGAHARTAAAGATDAAGVASEDWLARALEGIERSEYRFTEADAAFSAPNRAHDLRVTLGERGLSVASRTRGEEAWALALRLAAFGRGGRLTAAEDFAPVAADERVEYRRADLGIVEWYVNDSRGLEQGFTVARPPAGRPGSAPVVLAMALGEGLDPVLGAQGQSVVFRGPAGEPVLRYASLEVKDAAGRELPARMALDRGQLRLEIDDAGARYPLDVDPLVTAGTWFGVGNITFGAWVTSAGDVNGDGYSDVLVGAPGYNNGFQGGPMGRVFVFMGGPGGLDLVPAWQARVTLGLDGEGGFGAGIAGVGDVNGDGYDDIAACDPSLGSPGQGGEGWVWLWHGGPSSPDNPSGLGENDLIDSDWHAESNQLGAHLGRVAGAGDVNRDGFDDILVGAYDYTDDFPAQVQEGWAFVWYGSAEGMGQFGTPGNADWSAQSNAPNVTFGVSVAGAGDVNSDGYDDVIVGAPQGNAALLWLGGAGGLGANGTPFNADWSANGMQAGAELGACVAKAGDVNGDGYADVVIGAPRYDDPLEDEGAVFVWLGGPADLGANGNPANADAVLEGNMTLGLYGASVAAAGDVNGDGFGEVIVGSARVSNGDANEGRVYAYAGTGAGLATTPFWTREGNLEDAYFGTSVACAGDVDGDGFSDVIVGSPGYFDPEVGSGMAVLYRGYGGFPENSAAWIGESHSAGARFGFSLASAGDVNGDGYDDVIVGAPSFDGGQLDEGKVFVFPGQSIGLSLVPLWTAEGNQVNATLGYSVASAGDVNGDGYSDVIVGAPQYDDGVLANEGWAFAWHGSPTGLGAQGTPANADWSRKGGQGGASFGFSVAGAGDVDGDGFCDVVVGAPGFDHGEANEGRVYVFEGSTSGLFDSPMWVKEHDQASESFGYSVAGAGDVNGDGFSDLIVGGPYQDGSHVDEGRAYVFHGSAAGPSASVGWFADMDQANAELGHSVASAGDVNGDGYSDVIVGAYRYDGPEVDEGAAFIYLGSAAGLGAAAAWRAESNQANAHLGWSVASAGDVSGDGASDVIVGAPDYDGPGIATGKAFLWRSRIPDWGSIGTPATANWSDDGTQAGQQDCRFGICVASAGDVNGDGFADVLVGAHRYSDPDFEEGAAFCFYGNERRGMDRVARQLESDQVSPVAVLGLSDSPTSFTLEVRGRTLAGRGRVGLEVEVEPLGTPFDGLGLTRTPLTDSGTPGTQGSVVTLATTVEGLAPGTAYHWRARVITDSPLFPHGPWLTLAANAQNETDLRTPSGTVSAPSAPQAASGLSLSPARPNPARGPARLEYSLPRAGRVVLALFDVQGRRQATLVDEVQAAGGHATEWSGRDAGGIEAPAGTYFARLRFEDEVRVTRVTRVR